MARQYVLILHIRTKPYIDHYHEYLEYFLVIVNVATIALSMLFYNNPLLAGELIIGMVMSGVGGRP